jgi:hypothetical protein
MTDVKTQFASLKAMAKTKRERRALRKLKKMAKKHVRKPTK